MVIRKGLYTLSFSDISDSDINNSWEVKMVYSMWDMMYGYSSFWIVFMILFWAAVIWLIVWIVQQITKNKESPNEILEKRYIRGEISKKQYQEIKKTLRR